MADKAASLRREADIVQNATKELEKFLPMSNGSLLGRISAFVLNSCTCGIEDSLPPPDRSLWPVTARLR